MSEDTTPGMLDQIDALLEAPYWVVDLLPQQVPVQGEGQFFAVEHWLMEAHQDALRQRFAEVLLKLNCYYDMTVVRGEQDEGVANPAPHELVAWAMGNHEELSIVLTSADALITLSRDTTCMTLYNPAPELLDLVRQLAAASGLFVWQPELRP